MKSTPRLIRKPCLLFCMLLACGTAVRGGEHWTEFRGSSGDGKADGGHPPIEWSESKQVLWKTAIHGRGWSSPVVWGNQIWLTTATETGHQMSVVCVNLETGKIEHDILLFENAEPQFCHPTNSYASPTPVVEAGRVYAHFGSYGTACLDTSTGAVLWQRRDLPCDHFRGPGSSPILYGDRLFVAFDGFDVQYVVAFDKLTGDTVWKQDRNIDYGSDDGDHYKAYSTAHVASHQGRPLLVSPSAAATVAYDPETGREQWRFMHGGMNTATRPVVVQSQVLVTTGDAIGQKKPALIAIPLELTGTVDESQAVWDVTSGTPKRCSPLAADDWVFIVTDDGIATCLDASTGEPIWRQRLGGNYRASPVYAGGRIYCFNLEGDGIVLQGGREFRELARNQLEHGCQASPAVIGDSLIVRTTNHLYRLGSTP